MNDKPEANEKTTRSRSAKPRTSRKKAAPVPPAVETAAPAGVSYERVAQRAYELFLERGGRDGNAFEDWVRAERELGVRRPDEARA